MRVAMTGVSVMGTNDNAAAIPQCMAGLESAKVSPCWAPTYKVSPRWVPPQSDGVQNAQMAINSDTDILEKTSG